MFTIRRILHPTDFSDHSSAALRLAFALAEPSGARLIVLHAIAPSGFDLSRAIEEASLKLPVDRPALEEQLRQLGMANDAVPIEPRLVEGEPVAEILREAGLEGCDLIVMGTRGRSEVSHAPVGSVAEAIVRRAPCPVLTVRAPAHTVTDARETPFQGTAKE